MSHPARPASRNRKGQSQPSAALQGAAPPSGPADWTTRLALALTGADGGDPAELWANHLTGDAAVDDTRLTLLGLLTRRQMQRASAPRAQELAPLPDWPDADQAPLPPFHPTGAPGCSLVVLAQDGDTAVLAENLPSWLASGADEVLIVELAARPILAQHLRDAGLAAPPLRLAEIAAPDVTPTQGWNAGLRLARCQRVICLGPAVALPPDYLARAGVRAGAFALVPGPTDGRAFLLDLDRRDVARVGGFNEHLSSADFAPDEIAARLMAAGLVPSPPQNADIHPPAPKPLPAWTEGSLRAALAAHPALAGLRNRHVAALMPDWQGNGTRAFAFAGAGPLGPRLSPIGGPRVAVPVTVQTSAEARALSDLVAAHLGGMPVLLGQRRLDMVLARPVQDVTALDVAVAASNAPDAVRTRRAWLVLNIASQVLPLTEGPALAAITWLLQRAEAQGLSLALQWPGPPAPEPSEPLVGLPVVPADAELTRGFWPASLRDLAQDRPLPHSTLALDQRLLDDHARFTAHGPALFHRRPKLYIDAQHGLGNRLRAMASAAAIADATGRELIVIWQPDAHCACHFEDLFEPHGAVISRGFHREAPGLGLDLYNYMEVEPGSAKDTALQLGALRDAYLRSAYPVVHPASTWASENAALRRFVPNEVVRDLVASVRPARPALSVHIRMEGGRGAEHLAYESADNWTAAAHRDIDHWRRRSHFRFFQARIDQLVANGQADSIFLATDTPTVYDHFATRYGSRVSHLPRSATDRSVVAMVHAFADALLLSRAPRILGSSWSSFTELAARLADHPVTVDLSGRDF